MDEPVREPRIRRRQVTWRPFLGPAGGAIAAICFFLPWGRFSFLVVRRSASGHTIGGWTWAIFALALSVTFAGVVLPRRWRPAPARAVVFGAALLGLLLFVVRAHELTRGIWTPFGRVPPQDIGVKPGLGAKGTVVGFLLAIAGAFLMPGPRFRWMPAWRALTRAQVVARDRPTGGLPVAGTSAAGDTPAEGTPGERMPPTASPPR
jgi:hypothetical protein